MTAGADFAMIAAMFRSASAVLLVVLLASPAAAAPVFEADFSAAPERWKVEQKGAARFDSDGLILTGPKGVRFEGQTDDVVDAVRSRGEITVSAWFRPDNKKQEGPARIFTFSKSSSERNFTIGQEGDRYEVRLRTTKVGKNGTPGLQTRSGSVRTALTHLVFTRSADGRAAIYLDGEIAAEGKFAGELSNWDRNFRIAVGDEWGGNRAWKGSLLSVSLRDEVMTPGAVRELFTEGPGATSQSRSLAVGGERGIFEEKIAGIITRHCLECHDSASAKGDLDLSRKSDAHVEEGILVAGDPLASLLWETIESDEMPSDRPPLSAEEKSFVREWIEKGASWTVDFVDPAIYARPPVAQANRARRLTRNEYVSTVRDVFGVDLAKDAETLLPADVRADGFSNTAYNLTVDLGHVEAYAQLASILADRVDAESFAKQFSKKRDHTDKTMIPIVESMGEMVLRGPLDDEETALYRGISTAVAASGGSFDEAIATIVEAMVQSPRFLYRVERVPNGRPQRAGDYEMATRLSYAIWGSAPDRELLKKAKEGRLHSADEMTQEADRLLADDRAREHSRGFVGDWLHLDRLSHLHPNPDKFPEWDSELAGDMRRETFSYFDEVIWGRKLPLAALLDTPVGFMTPSLAEHYGLDRGLVKGGFEMVDLADFAERGGILTHGSVLTVGGDEASMVSRGLFVLNDLLRGVIQDPPPCVDTTPVASKPGLTQRAVALERVESKACGGCHKRFEPLAFGLEKFDGLGSFQEKDEYGNGLREDGEVLFPGQAEPVAFESVEELMSLLAQSDRVRETLTWKMVQWVMGRPLGAADAPQVRLIHEEAAKSGGRYTDTMHAIVRSDLFLLSYPETDSES